MRNTTIHVFHILVTNTKQCTILLSMSFVFLSQRPISAQYYYPCLSYSCHKDKSMHNTTNHVFYILVTKTNQCTIYYYARLSYSCHIGQLMHTITMHVFHILVTKANQCTILLSTSFKFLSQIPTITSALFELSSYPVL